MTSQRAGRLLVAFNLLLAAGLVAQCAPKVAEQFWSEWFSAFAFLMCACAMLVALWRDSGPRGGLR